MTIIIKQQRLQVYLCLVICFFIVRFFFTLPNIAFADGEIDKNQTAENVLEAPVGFFILFQKDDIYGAFKIVSKLENKKGWRYEWVLGADDKGRFNSAISMKGTGEVFELYERTQKKSGGYDLIDRGSNLYIKIGPDLMFEWSYPLWVYFKNEKSDGTIRHTVTDVSKLELLSISALDQKNQ